MLRESNSLPLRPLVHSLNVKWRDQYNYHTIRPTNTFARGNNGSLNRKSQIWHVLWDVPPPRPYDINFSPTSTNDTCYSNCQRILLTTFLLSYHPPPPPHFQAPIMDVILLALFNLQIWARRRRIRGATEETHTSPYPSLAH